MKKKVFIINGMGGCGKDTFVDAVRNILWYQHTAIVANYSSVDEIKVIAELAGWNNDKSEKGRKFLSELKALCTWYSDLPFKKLCESYNHFIDDEDVKILFLHIREPKEIERVKDFFHAKTILVSRDSVPAILSNSSDASVNQYEYDIYIDNNGTLADLREEARKFIAKEILE